MGKNDNDDMNKPVSQSENDNDLFNNSLSSPALKGFGQEPGDKISLTRENGDMVSKKRNKNKSTSNTSIIDGKKNSSVVYDTGTTVSYHSTKDHKKK